MPYGINIDLDAVPCADLGHHWIETFFGRAPRGKLKGTPIRCSVCETCGSGKIEHLSWSGRVVGRDYDPDEVYIQNARMLSDTYHERRMALRRAKAQRLKREGERGEMPERLK